MRRLERKTKYWILSEEIPLNPSFSKGEEKAFKSSPLKKGS